MKSDEIKMPKTEWLKDDSGLGTRMSAYARALRGLEVKGSGKADDLRKELDKTLYAVGENV